MQRRAEPDIYRPAFARARTFTVWCTEGDYTAGLEQSGYILQSRKRIHEMLDHFEHCDALKSMTAGQCLRNRIIDGASSRFRCLPSHSGSALDTRDSETAGS